LLSLVSGIAFWLPFSFFTYLQLFILYNFVDNVFNQKKQSNLQKCYWWRKIFQDGWGSSNALDLYLWGIRFKSNDFAWFCCSFQKCWNITLKKFITVSFWILTYINQLWNFSVYKLHAWKGVVKWPKNRSICSWSLYKGMPVNAHDHFLSNPWILRVYDCLSISFYSYNLILQSQ
jgi:hypothetical protein